jgi:DNA-binding NarL/FixJ family response regulator
MRALTVSCGPPDCLQSPQPFLNRKSGSPAPTVADVGKRFSDADLIACAHHLEGRAAIRQDRSSATRELQVLRLVAAGKTSKAIATLLSLSERTNRQARGQHPREARRALHAAATVYAYRYELL